jgi:hypothetical protein
MLVVLLFVITVSTFAIRKTLKEEFKKYFAKYFNVI